MDDILKKILKEYLTNVEEVCNILLKYLNNSENLNLKSKYDFFVYRSSCKKMEFEAEGIHFRLHGKGCIAFSGVMFLDWDFGYRSRWCGINPWKVAMTLRKNGSPYVDDYDGSFIQNACEQFVNQGIMFKQNDQYYFEITEDETFKPNFPTEYDTLVIEYSDLSWSMPRNKTIDRFIRKSTRVHNQINKTENKCILKFVLNGKEIYTIPYNDTSYPANAVNIMNDEILKKLLKV